MKILEKITCHNDLVNLTDSQRTALCQEIRDFLVLNVSKTGGHLASNLGVVELTVALETVFDTEKDRLVFDVGHQSYVHKLLTGRQTAFKGLRQFGGIAGFPKPSESNTDAFVAGHASSSVSIALGMARARTLLKEDYDVVALLGDGAATGGMIYEGLNDASESREPLIVILNDNEMSIDRNVGGMSHHLSHLRTKERYLGMKAQYREAMHRFPGGAKLYDATSRFKNWVKRSVLPTTLFENMGMTYLGPVDGHDVQELIRVLKVAKGLRCPVLLHVLTQKGRGYLQAEEKPWKYHGIGKFNPLTGEVFSKSSYSFSEAFGDTMCCLAQENGRICAITAAMPGGTGLLNFKNRFPDRLFDVGIAEEHAVSMAGGLAKQGMVPVVAIYSTFLQRSFDQMMQDIAMLNLHVVFAVDRCGLVGEDGETHHGVFDVGYLRQIPNMTVLSPANCAELTKMLTWAVNEGTGPIAIRYPRGGDGAISRDSWNPGYPVTALRSGKDAAIVTYGTLVNNALAASELLAEQGINCGVIQLTQLQPLPESALEASLSGHKHVLVVEECCSGSGISQSLAWMIHQVKPDCNVRAADLGPGYVTHGNLKDLYRLKQLDAEGISQKVQEVLSNEN